MTWDQVPVWHVPAAYLLGCVVGAAAGLIVLYQEHKRRGRS